MHSRRRWIGVSVAVTVVVLAVAWTAWTAYRVNRELNAAVASAADLRHAVETKNDAATRAAVAGLTEHSRASADLTHGLTWDVLTVVPVVGDDAKGLAVASEVAQNLSEHGVTPLIEVTDRLDTIVPKDGKIDVAALQQLQAPVDAGMNAFDDADARLAAQDSSTYVTRLRTKYRELAATVHDAAQVLRAAHQSVEVLPSLLGADGRRNYLLVVQNNAEIRATGGLPGSVSLVQADRGKLTMTRQVASGSFGNTARPVLPLTKAEDAIYGPILGTFFLDANLQPDYPRAAELWRARWRQVYPERVDGVVSIDPVALSYLLQATGPVQVGNVSLGSDNAVSQLLHQVYLRYSKPAAQDAWFRQVARAVFDRVSSGVSHPRELVNALVRATREHRVLVHSFDPADQAELDGTTIAGQLVTDPEAPPQVGVYINDGTGAKMSYYLRYDVNVDVTSCINRIQRMSARAWFISDAPVDAASMPDYVTGGGDFGTKPGSQYVLVYIYAPVGGDVSTLMLNGEPVDTADPVVDRGRTVYTVALLLKPREKVDLTWQMQSGVGQRGDASIAVTPSVEEGSKSMTAAGAC